MDDEYLEVKLEFSGKKIFTKLSIAIKYKIVLKFK